MLVIKDINRYRDGGSIGIDVIYSKGYNDTFELEQTLGPEAKFKALVIKALEQRIKHDKYALDQMR